MDLTKGPPRSPYEKLGGIVFLPRSIDKVRAHIAGTAGEYKAMTGYSEQLFDFLDLSPQKFQTIVRSNLDDASVLAAIQQYSPRITSAITAFNQRATNYPSPEDEAGWERHWELLEAAGQGHRNDIKMMFDRLDLDDGREVPLRP